MEVSLSKGLPLLNPRQQSPRPSSSSTNSSQNTGIKSEYLLRSKVKLGPNLEAVEGLALEKISGGHAGRKSQILLAQI
jgi:hypothetical protein